MYTPVSGTPFPPFESVGRNPAAEEARCGEHLFGQSWLPLVWWAEVCAGLASGVGQEAGCHRLVDASACSPSRGHILPGTHSSLCLCLQGWKGWGATAFRGALSQSQSPSSWSPVPCSGYQPASHLSLSSWPHILIMLPENCWLSWPFDTCSGEIYDRQRCQ